MTRQQVSKRTSQGSTSSQKEIVTRNYSLLYKTPCSFTYLEPATLESVNNGGQRVSQHVPEVILPAKKNNSTSDTARTNNKKDAVPAELSALKLGSGTMVHKLGEGGNSRVYKIWNKELELYRAVKLCTIGDFVPDALKRFETEAKIAAQLHHPNIVEVYSIGSWMERPYLEMEFIDGVSVDMCINRGGRIPEQTALLIIWYLCEALQFAHTQEFVLGGKTYNGIIHRDLKPGNVMISRKGVVKLLDFGIARPCETSLCDTVESDKVLGTLQYLSPEQMLGSDIDARADIYSLGLIFYEMLTGRQTFPQSDLGSIVSSKLDNAYIRLDQISDLTISKPVIEIVNKCLNFTKEERFGSMTDLINVLETIIDKPSHRSSAKNLKDFISPLLISK